MSSQSYKWLRPPVREGVDQGAFSYAYPYGNNSDPWKVRELTLTKSLMEHQLAVFQIISPTGDDWPRWDPYTPIRIDYGNRAGNSTSFHGYVWKPDSEINQQVREPLSQRAMTFCALGASYVMKEGFTQVFTNDTASNIAQAIATNFKFDSNITGTTYVWNQLSSSGGSYFEFMQDVALRTGDFFFCDDTTLYFIEPLGLAKQMSQYPAYYSKDAVFPNPKVYNTPTLIHFESDLSELTETPGRTKAVWNLNGIDLSTGALISATNDGTQTFGTLVTGGKYGDKIAGRYVPPVFDRFAAKPDGPHPALVPNTQYDAQSMVATRAANNRFPIRARVELFGNCNLLPGQIISLHGLGSRNSGKWLISSLTHRVVWKNWFSTEVELMRDSDFDPNPGGVDPSLVIPPKVIPTILVGGVWRAQYGVKQPTNLNVSVANIVTPPPATPPVTSPNGVHGLGSITSPPEFSSALLFCLGINPANVIQINLINAWQSVEGMWDESLLSDGSYPGGWTAWGAPYMCNPLNIGGWESGSNGEQSTYDNFPVTYLYTSITGVTFSFNGNWTNGVNATAYALLHENSSWPAIVAALKQSSPSAFFAAVGAWNPGESDYSSKIEDVYNSGPT